MAELIHETTENHTIYNCPKDPIGMQAKINQKMKKVITDMFQQKQLKERQHQR